MDSLNSKMQIGMEKFIYKCKKIKKIETWSSLVTLQDLNELLRSTKMKEANLVHATVQSFCEKIAEFKQ